MKEMITVVFYGYGWKYYYYYFYFVTFSSLAEKGKILGNMLQVQRSAKEGKWYASCRFDLCILQSFKKLLIFHGLC